MGIIARKYNSKNVKYDQLKGSGLLPRGPICRLAKCAPTGIPTPTKPVPKQARRPAPKPLVAVKKSVKSNKWCFNGIRYPDFNSFWVNIPLGSFTVLKVNGKTN
jgi:hypothetical protein